MESKVYEAALEGSVSSLLKLLEQDARILDRCSVLGVEGNPLHIAALHGHAHFAKEIINRKPEFVRELNSQGYLPLHLASAKRNVEMVKDLLQADPETCLVRDPDGRIPLHTAAIKGRVEVLEALVSAKPVTTRVLTKGGESILHLCLKQENDLFKCIKKLVELVDVKERGEFVNMKDNDDNTILHLSTANKQFQILEWAWVCSGGSKSKKELEKEEASLNDSRNTLVVVAILIATVTYTSGLTPPGGFWQGEFKKNEVEFNTTATESNRTAITDHSEVAFLAIKENEGESNKTANEGPLNRTAIDDYSGVAVLAIKNNVAYSYYIIFNSIGFLASLSIILLLISGFPIRRKACRITLMVILWIAISSMVITYTVGVINTCSWAIIPGKAPRKRTVTFLSLGVMGILLLGGPFIRLIAQLRRRFVIPMQCVIPKENEKKKVVDV
ncbi:uncharacterized protein LOC143879318 isoform X2 [Tasmannia lanceolata]|uniref:uncharacterized protein LOC143879318 isoform X2 n=1 Tax=Tasmannia lanceolata TaxID=3420 RepID=UPI00406404A0